MSEKVSATVGIQLNFNAKSGSRIEFYIKKTIKHNWFLLKSFNNEFAAEISFCRNCGKTCCYMKHGHGGFIAFVLGKLVN